VVPAAPPAESACSETCTNLTNQTPDAYQALKLLFVSWLDLQWNLRNRYWCRKTL